MANDFTVPDGPPTQAKRVQAIGLLLVSLLILAILYRMQDNKTPPVRLFKELKPETFASVIAWLFAVALFVERAIEVVVLVFRDQTAELLDRDENRGITGVSEQNAVWTIIYPSHTNEARRTKSSGKMSLRALGLRLIKCMRILAVDRRFVTGTH